MNGKSFPSLIFTGAPVRGDIDGAVFRDLKMDALFSREALSVMSGICPESDLPLRREIFESLSESGAYAAFRSLSGAFTDAADSDALYRSVSEKYPGYRSFLFAALCRKFVSACKAAAGFSSDARLFARFSERFAELTSSPEFADLAAAAEKCADGSDLRLPFSFVSGADTVSFSSGEDPGLWAGIDPAYAPEPSRADPEFADQVVSLDGKLLAAALEFHYAYRKIYETLSDGFYSYSDEFRFIAEVCGLVFEAKEAGLPLCFPELTQSRRISAQNAYDLTLLAKGEKNIVPNDFRFTAEEPFFFLSGANGGGKTTYLRNVGVNVILALSGAPAAADSMELCRVDGVFTHFPADEDFEGEGRFANEKRRAGEILARCGDQPLALLNETFSTTVEEKSRSETVALTHDLVEKGAFGVYVTHTSGVSADRAGILVCETVPDGGNTRTYRIVRADGGGASRARDVLKKYSLDAESLEKRLSRRGVK